MPLAAGLPIRRFGEPPQCQAGKTHREQPQQRGPATMCRDGVQCAVAIGPLASSAQADLHSQYADQ